MPNPTPAFLCSPASTRRLLAALTAFVTAPALFAQTSAPAPTPAPTSPAASTGLFDALAKGKFSAAARYRYEIYEQDSVPGATTAGGGLIEDTAVASTLRLALGYQTADFHGFTGFVELAGVYSIGNAENYRIPNHPDQGAKTRAIIADPLGTELNQAYVKWQVPDTGVTVLAGREAYAFNNGRFISFSGWRQSNQTIDLARVSAKFAGAFTANYAYLTEVHRVIGPDPTDGSLGMDSHVATLDYAKKGVVNASAYTVLLDYDRNNPATVVLDTASTGLRLTGPYKLNDTWSVLYTADYARQTDYADNPGDISLDYWCLELGVGYQAQKFFAGYTVLGGDATGSFRTPLAHPFNGWTEKFLNTPAAGLEAFYVTATGPVPGVKDLTYIATFYDYSAESTDADYGTELDAALEWKAAPIHPNLTLGWRFGQYFADELFTDSLRTSVYAAFKF